MRRLGVKAIISLPLVALAFGCSSNDPDAMTEGRHWVTEPTLAALAGEWRNVAHDSYSNSGIAYVDEATSVLRISDDGSFSLFAGKTTAKIDGTGGVLASYSAMRGMASIDTGYSISFHITSTARSNEPLTEPIGWTATNHYRGNSCVMIDGALYFDAYSRISGEGGLSGEWSQKRLDTGASALYSKNTLTFTGTSMVLAHSSSNDDVVYSTPEVSTFACEMLSDDLLSLTRGEARMNIEYFLADDWLILPLVEDGIIDLRYIKQ